MLRRIAAFALVVLLPLAAQWSGLLAPIENQLVALRMEEAPRPPTGNLVVVDIDSKSIAAIGSWPWPRRLHADLIDKLVTLGASEIALDIDFSASTNPVDDAALADAIKRADGRITLASFVQKLTAGSDSKPVYNRPRAEFAANAWVGSVTVRPERDGMVRGFNYGLIVDGHIVPSVPALLAGGLGEPGQEFLIDFGIDVNAIDRIPVIDVLRGTVDPARVAGKKVIVGAQAVELRDFFNVPVAGTISGALLQAAATETLLQGRVLHETNFNLALAGLLILGLATLIIGRLRWSVVVGGLLGVAVAVEGAATYLQTHYALAVDTAPWHLALVIFAVVVLVSEIDFRQLLQTMWRVRASNAQAVLSQVVADNFAGVVVIDEDGVVRAASHMAAQLLGHKSDLAGLAAHKVLPAVLASPVDAVLTVAGFDRVMRHPNVVTFRRADGQERALEYIVTISRVENERGREGGPQDSRVACLTFTDVTEQRANEARIERMARFDTLTELPNRNQLIERLAAAFTSDSTDVRSSAIACFDVDGFKSVNETLGHHIGDLLLTTVASRATALLPHGAFVARLGADEFAAVFAGRAGGDAATAFATQIVAAVAQPFNLEGHQMFVTASAGVALADARDKGADDILRRADVARNRAKASGGNTCAVFERVMLQSIVDRQRLERELWQGLERGEFEVWYQPQVNLKTERLTGVEALLRWRHPRRGLVNPAEFIPVAEAIGLIDELGTWVMETACAEAARWPGALRLAVNVSSGQFARCEMADVVERALALSHLPAGRLDIEITESLFMQPSKSASTTLQRLRALGVGIALDDFGTGYSSLSYIQKFPISKIKLDQSFVAGLPENVGSASIVRAVAGLARDLDLHLNAEGVENAAQVAFLDSVGVDEAQGYLFGRPLKPDEMAHRAREAANLFRLSA